MRDALTVLLDVPLLPQVVAGPRKGMSKAQSDACTPTTARSQTYSMGA